MLLKRTQFVSIPSVPLRQADRKLSFYDANQMEGWQVINHFPFFRICTLENFAGIFSQFADNSFL